MANTLSHRLAKLEEKLPKPQRKGGRLIRIVASAEERDEAYKLALAEGFDRSDDGDDILIMRLITAAPGRQKYSQPPRVL
jgi:hypothetical protein